VNVNLHLVTRKRIVAFMAANPRVRRALGEWAELVEASLWNNIADVRRVHPCPNHQTD
jgi:mRNA-degrading endonuclease HigB of HigAB toxin-antitoxin module